MVANSIRWTTRDLDAMPDDGGWKRYEIIDGELFVTRSPHFFHQSAASRINTCLENWSTLTGLGRSLQTPGVVFSPTDAVIPDIVWISQARLANGLDESGHFIVAPEIMVEILSPGERNEQRDREVKRKLYSLHGVLEYWIVNWQMKSVEVYRRSEAQLRLTSTLLAGDTLTTQLLPGFSLPIAEIFV
jgi:Uma2 family endonuclease